MMAAPWSEGWVRWRNDRLASPRFQQWAADFPLTRSVARRRAQGLFDIVSGFVYSQTLDACLRLGILDRLAQGPQTPSVLAEVLGLPLDSLQRLLGAAGALDLVQPVGADQYALGTNGAALRGNAGLKEMIEHHRLFYNDLADSEGLLRRSPQHRGLADYWPYANSTSPKSAPPQAVSAYSGLMAATLPSLAADIFKAYPVQRHRRLMDVGGGEGAFVAEAGARAPKLHFTLFDLPSVADRARVRLAGAGLLERTEIVGGDFLSEPLPKGADLITLIRILHDHDEAGVLALLRAARTALPSDGALLIAEPMSQPGGKNRFTDAYFAFYLLAMGRGRARKPSEIFALLREAGFRRSRVLRTRTQFLMGAILARP
jgi:demethylspheroidene O-methyltransferase